MVKVVEGSDVEFQETHTQPDSLDQVVQADSTTTTHSLFSQEDEHMMDFLGNQVNDVLINFGKPPSPNLPVAHQKHTDLDYAKYLLPRIVTLREFSKRVWDQNCISLCARLDLELNNDHIIGFLKNMYGDDIVDTGLVELAGLDQKGVLDFSGINKYFDEFRSLQKMHSSYVCIRENPYLKVLTLPLEHRPFFTGVLKDMNATIANDSYVEKLQNPVTLRDILSYARKVEKIPKVGEYVQLYLK